MSTPSRILAPRPTAFGLALLLLACNDHEDVPAAPDAGSCELTAAVELSAAIPTVGIVTWSGLDAFGSARIEFGRDTSYGMTAPVDLADPAHRTLLLGMTTNTEYHFRLVAGSNAATSACTSSDYSLTTGPGPTGLALPTVTSAAPAEIASGFLLLSNLELAGPGGGPKTGGPRQMGGEGGGAGAFEEPLPGGAAGGVFVGTGGAPGGMSTPEGEEPRESVIYILNHSAELVWWKTVPIGEVTRVAMSYDGKHVLALSLNVSGSPSGSAVSVSMDGLDVETWSMPNAHHDFTPLPDDSVVFIRKSPDGCDELTKRSQDGSLSRVFLVADAFDGELAGDGPGMDLCHTNSVHYHPEDDSFTFSVLNLNTYVKVRASGELEWRLGGTRSDFAGDGAEWQRQHGHQLLGPDRLLFFNNGDGSAGGNSLALEVALDSREKTAKRVWSYDGAHGSAVLGDVRRLPNGNTLVAYSTSAVMHEVNASGSLVQVLTWPLGGTFGYVEHRPTLYGPPTP